MAMTDETDAFKEGAKAVQEVAKVAGKVVDAGTGTAGWLDRLFGAGLGHAVGRRWSDRQLVARIEASILDWGRLELLLHKVQQRLKAAGTTQTRMPPPKIVLPLLEHATMEYEDDLHTMYANLLASALDPEMEIEKKFVSVLAELSGTDVRVLRDMFAAWLYYEEKLPKKKNEGRYSSGVTGSNETSVIAAYRLGIVLPVQVEVNSYEPGGHDDRIGAYGGSSETHVVQSDLTVVAFTEFGEKFCMAIMGDVSSEYTPPTFPTPRSLWET
jgi:Abortive infection alpha